MGNTFKLGNYVNGIFQDASNNIGIGGSPSGSYKLEVTGTGRFSGTATFSSIIYGSNGNLDPTAGTNAGTTLALNGNSAANNYSIGLAAIRNSAYDMFFQTGATNGGGYRWYIGTSEKMTMTSTGYVGIGTSSPTSLLHLSSSSGNTAQSITTTGAGSYGVVGFLNTTTGYGYDIGFGGSSTIAPNSFYIYGGSSASLKLQISSAGWVYLPAITDGAGSYALKWRSGGLLSFDVSSARYKDNIRDSSYGLSDVMKLRSAMFEYKKELRTDIGLIAEEIYEVIPELVTLDDDGLPNAVAYDRFVSVLIKSVQELSAQNQDLKSRLDKAGL